jgi:hypothetical protein
MTPHPRLLAFALFLGMLLSPGIAIGQLAIYDSIDVNIGPGAAHPNYDAKVSQFESNTGAFNVITFEGLTPGPFTNPSATETPASATIALGQGVQATLTGVDPRPPAGSIYGITSDTQNQFLGFNVTPGGSQFLRVVPFLQSTPTDVTFHFSENVTSFGMAITGLGGTVPGLLELKFTPLGGTPQDLTIAGNNQGGLVFYGVSGFGQTNQFTLQMSPTIAGTRDIIGIDDLRFATVVPEPASWVLIIVGGTCALAATTGRWPRRCVSAAERSPQ